MKKIAKPFLIMLFVASALAANAQSTFFIYGDIKTSTGEPVPDASVTTKKLKFTTTSDSTGKFRTYVVDKDTLIITHVGFKSSTFIVDEKMEDYVHVLLVPLVNELQEVIVSTGYQDVPKERATGSFYKLDNKLLNQRVSPDIISRLDGLTSGLLIDRRDAQQPNIQLRGLSTLSFNGSSPLIVLDNFPYAGDINNINPNDIESITVLKDAAASSIWGARAGNGVIVITTKKAKGNQPLSVSFNANLTFAKRPDLFSAKQIPVSSFIDLEKKLFDQGYYDGLFSDQASPGYSEAVDILNRQRNGELNQVQADEAINSLRNRDVRNDMQKYLYRNSINQQYYLNLTGAGTRIRYLFSAGYDKNLSALQGNQNDRITLRSNNSVDLTRKWQFQSDIILTKTKGISNSPGGFGSYKAGYNSISPYASLVNADGSPAAIDLYYSKAFTDTAGNGKLMDWKYRPLQELNNNDNRSGMSDILVNLGTSYRILPWLKADFRYQYHQSWSSTENLQNLESFTARDYINRFTQINGNAVTYVVPKNNILYSSEQNNRQQGARGQLNFDHIWANKHQVSAIAGVEVRETRNNSLTSTYYGYDPNTLVVTPVDYTHMYPTFNGVFGDSYITDGTRFTQNVNRFISTFANASYTYDEKYTLSASARRDASNIFGVSTNQKWVPLWSVGGLWRIDRENFYKLSWMPQLNLRLTYGISGNLSPNESALTRIQYLAASRSPLNLPYVGISAPPNPHLRWEQVRTFNAGLDFSLVGNRVTGSIEYYTKKSVDLINSVLLDPTVGFITANQNSASIFAKGSDIVINSLNIDGKLRWQSSLLFSYVNFKTIKNLNPPGLEGFVSDGAIIFPVVNYNPYVIVSYKWAGLDPLTGDPQGYVNGQVSKDYFAIAQNPIDQQVVSGSALPPVFGNLRNTIEWKKFSLAFNINYRFGYYFRKPVTNYSTLITYGTGYNDYEGRWQKPGDERLTNTPSFNYPSDSQRDLFYQYSSVNVEKADNVKLSEIYLSYDFSPKRKIPGVKSLQFYLFANQLNIILWKANKAGLDPDVLYSIKPPASFSAGIKANL
nr:SusC/RagA family TonB-linked outer membrane protein [uncultured Mucilaginibacter sp.]